VALYTVSNGGTIVAADVNQYFNLLTGTTTDQQVTVANRIRAQFTGATGGSGGYVGSTTGGAPVSGTFVAGDFVIDVNGAIWVCITAGSPGTWSPPPGALIAENVRTSSDQTVAAGAQLLAQSATLNVISGMEYLVTYEGRMTSSSTANNHLLTFKAASGASVTTGSADVSQKREWAMPASAVITPSNHSCMWTPGSTGQFTVGFSVNFFSGTGSSTVYANTNDAGILRVFRAT
jgi:hypothetical protein